MPAEDENLLNFVSALAGEGHLKVEEDLGKGFIRLRVTEAEKRQAKHDIRSVEDGLVEMLRNARDAGSSRLFLATSREGNCLRKVVLVDDGEGIPDGYDQRIFEPRVTSRLETVRFDEYGLHGRGLALFALRSLVRTVSVVSSLSGKGSAFRMDTDLRELPEKTDQSTFPSTRIDGRHITITKGVRNIPRVAAEFNVHHPELDIYYGSPAEIIATMRGLSFLEWQRRGFEGGPGLSTNSDRTQLSKILAECGLYLWEGIGLAEDAGVVAHVARTLYGLDISQRNAHRIIRNEVKLLEPLLKLLRSEEASKAKRKPRENLAQRIRDDEIERLRLRLEEELEGITAKYFLRISERPRAVRFGNQLKLVVQFEADDHV